ncbi:unnamed protein product [Gongylonema pulchrum]|uniref:PLU-1 domain-containing protein n=2 Tax=Gongylonema pulchrum TaxID=637853 RepID=A0A183E3Y3_9BILA|nr:unnamed protein product [Gongylonema pulchrum]
MALLTKAENALQRLVLDSFKVDETVIEQRKRRAVRLQCDLRSWIDAAKCVFLGRDKILDSCLFLQCMSEDKTALLEQFEALHEQLMNSLTEMEKIRDIEV